MRTTRLIGTPHRKGWERELSGGASARAAYCLLCISLFLAPAFAILFRAQAAEFYIAPQGNDANPGTRTAPFATPGRARDAARTVQRTEPIHITFRGGTYWLTEPLYLDPRDSGAAEAPVIWRAAEGEKVILSGGTPITGTWKTSEEDGVWRVELPGVARGWNFRQLFVGGDRGTRARYPNASEQNPFLYATGGGMDHVLIEPALLKETWGAAGDAQLNMVPAWKFFNQWNTVTGVDKARGRIDIADSERHGVIKAGNWFWIEGVKAELDEPGEWYLDREAGDLYYMPEPGVDPNTLHFVAPRLNVLICARGEVEKETHVRYVQFHDLEFRHTTFSLGHIEARVHTDAAIRFENASHCVIKHCHFENIGGYALWLHLDSRRNIFNHNTVLHAGGGGVLLTGARFSYMDDSKLYTPGAVAATVFPILNEVTRNTVQHCGRVRYYGGGVHLDSRPAGMVMAPGNYIAHNHFAGLSRNGIFAFRNQGGNVVEYNHIHDAMQTTIDGACIHFATMSRLNAPNYILSNWLYDIWGYEQRPDGMPKRHLANGVFLDWDTSNTTVKHNYIYNAGGQPVKTIWNNWGLDIADNHSAGKPVTPPFLGQVGPRGTATHGIRPEDLRREGRVIHYSDAALVTRTGDWQQRTITGLSGLFRFNQIQCGNGKNATITYTLPVEEDGIYQLSLLYKPDARNASNGRLSIHHANGVEHMGWDMRKGNEHGFANEVGKYRLEPGKPAKVTLSNEGADGLVIADSVAFVKTAVD